jgi:uncharacterized protein YceK
LKAAMIILAIALAVSGCSVVRKILHPKPPEPLALAARQVSSGAVSPPQLITASPAHAA